MTKRVVIVQPYVPGYRRAFFERLIEALRADGIECLIAAGEPDNQQAERGDAIAAPWVVSHDSHKLRIAGRTLELGGAKPWRKADAVIVGLVGSSAVTYAAILDGMIGRIKVGLWGHVRSYVSEPNVLDQALERWQMRHSAQVFAYTPGGSLVARAAGIEPERITTVMNAVDTASLEDAISLISPQQIAEFRSLHSLTDHTFAYIGGLDASKRIEFLADVLERLSVTSPHVRLLVGGRGEDSDLLNAAEARGQVIRLGHVNDHQKALMAAVSKAIVCPGRIGLVAVEALVLGVPIVTTNWPYHAPESEYLVEGESRLDAPDDPELFADYLSRMAPRQKSPSWDYPTIDKMVQNFRSGVLRMLQASSDPSES